MNPFKSLASKLILSTISITLLILGISYFFIIKAGIDNEIKYISDDYSKLFDTVSSHIESAMINKEKTKIVPFLTDLARIAHIETIRIIGKDGKISFSNIESEIGKGVMAEKTSPCSQCHSGKSLLKKNIYVSAGKNRIFHKSKKLFSRGVCTKCHGKTNDILATIVMDISLKKVDAKIQFYKSKLIISLIINVFAIIFVILIHVFVFIKRPINKILRSIKSFERGEYNELIDVTREDEIGMVAKAFNSMAVKIKEMHNNLEREVQDRTEKLISLSSDLREMQTKMFEAEKLSALGEIAAGVTHEIRNPLNSLSINLQLMQSEINNPCNESIVKCKETISELKRLSKLIEYEIFRINEVLEEFLKNVAFPKTKKEEKDIVTIIDSVISLVSLDAKNRGIRITRAGEGNFTLDLDENKIRQLFLNLLINGVNAVKRGGYISIEIRKNGDENTISVKDDGMGIAEKDLRNIFKPFFTTRMGGTGLGLAISRRIVEEHGWKIECFSTLGKGTEFIVRIPV